jgi:SAM-dependent methyltransferase
MARRVKRDFPRQDWDAYYRRYQRILADEYLIPVLSRWGVDLRGKALLEVGCGDGGCGAAFVGAGCRVIMMDIDERLVSLAAGHNEREGIDAKTYVGDILDDKAAFYREGPFDLVVFRDVIEHIQDPASALRIVRRFLSRDGFVFVIFPPYYSPYGAHQQILPRKRMLFVPYNKLPYLQLLPRGLFESLVGGETNPHREVRRLSGIRLTIRKFERYVREAGLVAARRKMFLSRPSFALRYGVPVVDASILGRIPVVREVAVTAAYYLLAHPPLHESETEFRVGRGETT